MTDDKVYWRRKSKSTRCQDNMTQDSGIGAFGRVVEHTTEENNEVKGASPKPEIYAQREDSFELYLRKDRVKKQRRCIKLRHTICQGI